MNKQVLIIGGAAVAGAGVGFGVGYLVFKKKFEDLAREEIESVKESYRINSQKKPDLQTLAFRSQVAQERAAAADEPEVTDKTIIAEQQYHSELEETDADAFRRLTGRVPTTEELVRIDQEGLADALNWIRSNNDHADDRLPEGNIFDLEPVEEPEGGVDVVVDESRPFVIDHTEWYGNTADYSQVTVTYWADDDVLADDAKRLIIDVDGVVGETNLHRFGFKSDNPDIVYVRNHARKTDYEITKDERNYAEVVHGAPSGSFNKSGEPRRMRSDDN